MLLKQIKLLNIRSYKDCDIVFPEGSIMLSGDIGAGKSTILQAVEFALFGITKEVSGASLLRNGEQSGAVELLFSIDSKDVLIRRTLKRSSSSVTQDYGHIILNGKKHERTATELKQEIIPLLQYPQELLTKKSMIYRYTVYTPQEEMKRILFEEKDHRLDTLRRVFGIDKYKNVCQATEVFVSSLKTRSKELAGRITDIQVKDQEKEKKREELERLKADLNSLEPQLESKKRQLEEHDTKLRNLESQKANLEVLQRDLAVVEAALSHKEADHKRTRERLSRIEDERKNILAQLKSMKFFVEKRDIDQKVNELEEAESKIRLLRDKIQELKTIKSHAEKSAYDIASFDICPTCKQNISKDHVHSFVAKEEKNIKDCEMQIASAEKDLERFASLQRSLKENIDKLRQIERETEIARIQQQNLDSRDEELKIQQHSLHDLEKDLGQLKQKKEALALKISPHKNIQQEYESIKRTVESLREEEKKLSIELNSLHVRSTDISVILQSLEKELAEKYEVKENIDYLRQMQHWLEEFFVPLVMTMEKSVMLKVHHDFDQLFQKWFSIIIDNEVLKIRLDNEFTPIIEQNGHEIEYSFLSGGEKTAAALAYRLALNQVINTLVSTIKTRDLIVLDEPTDGFSSEQLDRIRIVLDELKMKQIIIVSHENEIESFVNKIIRLEKQGHLTQVAQ